MRIVVLGEYMGTVNGELVRGDKFLVKFADGTEETFKCCSFYSLMSLLTKKVVKSGDIVILSDVIYLDEC